MAEKWEDVSITTISRDFDFMRNIQQAPIEYDAGLRGYYYSKANYRIRCNIAEMQKMADTK